MTDAEKIAALVEALEVSGARLEAVARVFNDSNFTDRYDDGPRCDAVISRIATLLAAIKEN